MAIEPVGSGNRPAPLHPDKGELRQLKQWKDQAAEHCPARILISDLNKKIIRR
jgi:hypothetical protein